MAIPDGNILTNLVTSFTSITSHSRTSIQGYSVKVLITLTTIDIIIACLISMMENQDLAKTLLRRSLKYCAFSYMVMSFKDIINAILSSFISIGLIAGGSNLTISDFTNPSMISTLGWDLVGPFLQNIINGTPTVTPGAGVISNTITTVAATAQTITSLPSQILLGLVYLMILACFFAIAINIFITYIEFAVFSAIALILVPFGVWDQTAFIFDKVKNGVINYSIKYMTLAVIASITITQIKTWQLPANPTFQQALYVLLGMMALTYLSWHAPAVASGFAGGHGGTASGAAVGGFVGSSMRNTGSVAGGAESAAKSVAGVAGAATRTGAGMAHKAMLRVSPNMYGGLSDKVSTATDQFKSRFGMGNSQSPQDAADRRPNPSGVNLNPDKPDTDTKL